MRARATVMPRATRVGDAATTAPRHPAAAGLWRKRPHAPWRGQSHKAAAEVAADVEHVAVHRYHALQYLGWFDPAEAARYGLVDIDWSNARAQWARHRPMDDDARLATEVAMVKANNPQTHVWICAPEHEAPCAAVTPPPLTCRTEPPAAPLLRPCG